MATILLISGSVGKRSCTRTMLQYLERELTERGIQTICWDLGRKEVPIAVPEFHNRQEEHPQEIVRRFNEAVKAADGIIIGSPLYHGSYSGVLKNALDNLASDAFMNKPIGLVSHSSNARSCVTPCNDLRPIVRSLGGYATRMQIGTTDSDYTEIDGVLTLKSEKIKRRADELLEELVILATTLSGKLRPERHTT